MKGIWKAWFWALAKAGRRLGGIPPRRLTLWLAREAYGSERPDQTEYRWTRDRDGLEYLLHPHFINDVSVIAFGSYEPGLQTLIRSYLKPGMVCIDVGANVGLVCLHMAQIVGRTGKVYAFEPVKHLFDSLRRNALRNQLLPTVEPKLCAVSNSTGRVVMCVHDEFEPNQGLALLVGAGEDMQRSHIEVESVTLDEFAAQRQLERLDFVKLDVQGAEYLVIEGARSCLERFGPTVVMELSSGLSPLGRSPSETLGLLESEGYEAFELTAGVAGRRLSSRALPPDFSAQNVLCRRPR